MENEARISTNPVFGNIVDKVDTRNSRSQSSSGRGGKRARELTLATQVGCDHSLSSISSPARSPTSTEDILCDYCNCGHASETCDALRRLPYQDRIQLLITRSICFGYLSKDHTARICRKGKSVRFPIVAGNISQSSIQTLRVEINQLTVLTQVPRHARRPRTSAHVQLTVFPQVPRHARRPRTSAHVRLTVIPTNSSSREETAHVRNGMINLGRSKIGMAVVPVKVWLKGAGTQIITYPFFFNILHPVLDDKVRDQWYKTKISLTTLEKKDSLIDSFVVKDLVISDLDENVFIELPALFTRSKIPVSKEDIPNQADVEKWPHLRGVHLPVFDADISRCVSCRR